MVGNKELITAQALADALDLSVETIWKYTREKRIPYIELGKRQYRYRLTEVISVLMGSAVQERASEYKAESAAGFTYQDYLKLPEEPGYRFEVLEGMLVRDPSPNVMHQRVSRRLQRILDDYVATSDPEGEIFDAPLDVTLQDTTVVQPDLLYVSGGQSEIVREARIDGAPTLMVEVLSPTSGRKDRIQKLQIYQQAGVQHYWLVDPEERTLQCFSLREGAYALVVVGMDDETIEHPGFPGLVIPLKALWHNVRPEGL